MVRRSGQLDGQGLALSARCTTARDRSQPGGSWDLASGSPTGAESGVSPFFGCLITTKKFCCDLILMCIGGVGEFETTHLKFITTVFYVFVCLVVWPECLPPGTGMKTTSRFNYFSKCRAGARSGNKILNPKYVNNPIENSMPIEFCISISKTSSRSHSRSEDKVIRTKEKEL